MTKDVSAHGKARHLRALRLELSDGAAATSSDVDRGSDMSWADRAAALGVPQEAALSIVPGTAAGIPVLRIQLESLNPNAKDVFG